MEAIDQSWRKSSYSGNGAECVEVTTWRKASYSGNGGASCVEVGKDLPGVVAVRDSKDPHGPVLTLPPGEWTSLTARLRPTA